MEKLRERRPPKGQAEQRRVPEDDSPEREVHRNGRAGQSGEKFHCADGVGYKRPGDEGGQLTERLKDHAEDSGQSAEDHHRRLGRQDERVGDERDQREAVEVVGHDREGGDLGGEGEQEKFADEGGGAGGEWRGGS